MDVDVAKDADTGAFILVRRSDGARASVIGVPPVERERLVSAIIANLTREGIEAINAQTETPVVACDIVSKRISPQSHA